MGRLIEGVKVLSHIPLGQFNNTSQNGTTIDGGQLEDLVFAFVLGSASAGTDPTMKIQESDDDSTWVDVSGSTIALDGTNDDETHLVSVDPGRRKRYVRAVLTETANVFCLGGVYAIARPKQLPVTQEQTTVDIDGSV